jgi:hypothetical protein
MGRYNLRGDVKLEPIALTAEQVDKYELPRIPIKDQDVRKANFEDRRGEGAVELDALEALHSGVLETLVRSAFETYRDPHLPDRLAEAEDEAQEVADEAWEEATRERRERLAEYRADVKGITAKFRQRLRAMDEELQGELAPYKVLLEFEEQEFRDELGDLVDSLDIEFPERPEGEIDWPDESDFLFDSDRDYGEQLEHYKRHKARG